MELFDSHAHYDDEKFNDDRKQVIESLKKNNVTKAITSGYSIQSSKDALQLCKTYPFLYTTCGISPNDVPENLENIKKDKEQLRNISKEDKVIGIGEIGLDYYWRQDNKQIQKDYFIMQIELANEEKLPIAIHTREAVMDTIEILKKYPVKEKGVFHCCPMNRELVKEALKLGFYISFAGPVTFKNAKNADEIIDMVPIDKIFIETDSPYLSPEPNRGKRNDSTNLIHIVRKIAQVKNVSEDIIAEKTFENICNLYKII